LDETASRWEPRVGGFCSMLHEHLWWSKGMSEVGWF
jgi:hypothetical protein